MMRVPSTHGNIWEQVARAAQPSRELRDMKRQEDRFDRLERLVLALAPGVAMLKRPYEHDVAEATMRIAKELLAALEKEKPY